MKTLDMPSFGADMETGKVVEWCAERGATLKKGETVALIETAKGLIDMEVFDDCVIEDFLVELDAEIDVGKPIISLAGSESASNSQQKSDKVESVRKSDETSLNAKQETAQIIAFNRMDQDQNATLRISPAAKQYIQTHGIRIDGITGTGVQGSICLADVENVSVKPAIKRGEFDTDMMRKAIASVVSKSKREIPHYYLNLDVDLTETEEWLIGLNESISVEERIMINAPIMCAISRALHKHPDFNGRYIEGHFEHAIDVHLGVAIRLRNKGLVTPAIHNADRLSVYEMMVAFKSIVERSKTGGLKQSELQDATTTLSNIGDRGSDQIFGVIFPPQVTIVGVGKINRKACVVDEKIVPRTVVNISLAADHRVTDGQMGARFLNDIQKLLQKPHKLEGGL
jgi:pyruvate dehydrogenase E2 component (dihydrolipoamide acetyltransferase)